MRKTKKNKEERGTTKMKKRITLLMLLAVLCMALCIACGKEETSSSRHNDDTEESGGHELSNDDKGSNDNAEEGTETFDTDDTDTADAGQDEVIPNLQMIIYSNTKADFVIANAYIEEGSNGESSVVFKTSSKVYDVGLYDRDGLECTLSEGSDPSDMFGGSYTPVGDCSYSYNGDTLIISVDLSDYGIDFDLHDVTDLVLCNGPEGNGWGPGFYTAAEVARDECSSHDAVADQDDNSDNDTDAADNGNDASSTGNGGSSVSSITTMDFSGEYTLVGGDGTTYFFLIKGEDGITGREGYTFKFFPETDYDNSGYLHYRGESSYYTWAASVFQNGGFDTCFCWLDGSTDGIINEAVTEHEIVFHEDGSITLTPILNGNRITGTFVRK